MIQSRSEDYKQSLEFLTTDNTLFVVRYGFSCIEANSEPYFSVTAEEWETKVLVTLAGDHRRVKLGSEPFACGSMHDRVKSVIPATLADERLKYVRAACVFHLLSPETGPMHYLANATYFLKQVAAGEKDHTDPWKGFLSAICWGALPTDDPTGLETLKSDLVGVSPWHRTLWLNRRLPELLLAFDRAITDMGLSTERDLAMAFFREDA